MAKKTTRPQAPKLKIKLADTEETPKESSSAIVARTMATSATVQAIYGMEPWVKQSQGDVDLGVLLDTLVAQNDAMTRGDMVKIELMLFNQSLTLQAMFTTLSRRAAMNVGEHMGAVDTYLRLALQAQSQCRSTLETLAEIKNPRPATFVKQANIANGPQQVNNGTPAGVNDPRAPARDIPQNLPNELLTDERATHDTPMDTRSKAAASRSDSGMETVDRIDRT